MSDTKGYDHPHIDIEGTLPESFQFNLHPSPTLEAIDAIPNGSEMILMAWDVLAPPPTIEGFEMTDEWKEFVRGKVPPEGRGLPADEVAFGNLFLFSLAPRSTNPEGLPSVDEIVDGVVVREEYDIREVRALVREAVLRAREGMTVNPF